MEARQDSLSKQPPGATSVPVQVPHLRARAEADAMFFSIGEGAIVTDSRGYTSRINDIALTILGIEESDILGKWYPGVITFEDEAGNKFSNINRPMTEVFLTGKPVFRRVYYRKSDGSRIALALTVSPVLLDGKPVGAIELFRDITEEVKLEKAKDEFISLVSHQLRTPATGVKQYAGMLLDGYAGDLSELQRSMVQTIYDSNERQIAPVNDLLRVAQVDAGQVKLVKKRTELTPLLRDIIAEQLAKFTARRQKIHYTHPAKEVWVDMDVPRMRMALENIIDNASKYTPEGKEIFVRLRASSKTAAISIRDQGIGIPQKDINHIFEKFARLNTPLSTIVGGTGLGLYWTKKIIDLHDAVLEVESKVHQGTTFTIRLPLSP